MNKLELEVKKEDTETKEDGEKRIEFENEEEQKELADDENSTSSDEIEVDTSLPLEKQLELQKEKSNRIITKIIQRYNNYKDLLEKSNEMLENEVLEDKQKLDYQDKIISELEEEVEHWKTVAEEYKIKIESIQKEKQNQTSEYANQLSDFLKDMELIEKQNLELTKQLDEEKENYKILQEKSHQVIS